MNPISLYQHGAIGYAEKLGTPIGAEAQDYFDRLDAAGDTTYVAYKAPLAKYINALAALGGAYWDDMLSSCLFIGVGFAGCTVPLRGGMQLPTPVSFDAGDHDALTGLIGDGTTKYIGTGVDEDEMGLNDASISAYVTEYRETTANAYLGGSYNARIFGNSTGCRGSLGHTSFKSFGSGVDIPAFAGISRDNSLNYDYSAFGQSGVETTSSTSFTSDEILVFRSSYSTNTYATARIATYHVGPALDLSVLEALQDVLLAEIAAI